MKAVGLMSGTSLDGVDVVLCEINGVDTSTKVKELKFRTYPFPSKLKTTLQTLLKTKQADLASLCSLNFTLGAFFAECVCKLCQEYGIKTQDLAYIASHGQTIYHIPETNKQFVKSTWQMGEAALLAEKCACPVIANFRVRDMAANGQGAPLVPFSEYLLYRQKYYGVALQNIGGIGNITVIPKNATADEVFAFDTGPGNMLINAAMQKLYDLDYDCDGNIAKTGTLIDELKQELAQHAYLQQVPPKTTGRELFGDDYAEYLLTKYTQNRAEDIVATLTWFTAYAIAYSYENYIKAKAEIKELVIGGGGAHNGAIFSWLKRLLPSIQICTQEAKGYSSDSKEAVAFVILGNQTLHNKASNLPSVTGANKQVILGQITY